jgi:hypothetical protein
MGLGIWLIIGLAIYFFYGMGHSRVGNEPEAAFPEKSARQAPSNQDDGRRH